MLAPLPLLSLNRLVVRDASAGAADGRCSSRRGAQAGCPNQVAVGHPGPAAVADW